MELRHLRYFIAVAQHLNFSEAARRLHVAQPAISQTVLDLESELGVKLLLRTRPTLQLTAAGQTFEREAIEIVHRSERAILATQCTARGEVGCLGVGFLPSACVPILPGLIEAYRRRFPQVSFRLHEMTPAQQLKAFDEKRINLGFSRTFPPERAKEFNVEILYHDRLEIALPRKHPMAAENRIVLKNLSAESFVQFHRPGSPVLFDEVVATCRRAGFSPNIIQEPELLLEVMLLVESGLGISLVPGCARNLNHPNAVLRTLKPVSHPIPLCVIWPKSTQTPILDSFLEIVRSARPAIQKQMEHSG